MMEIRIDINGGVQGETINPIKFKYNKSPYELYIENDSITIKASRKEKITNERVLTGIVQKALLGYFLKTNKCLHIKSISNNGNTENLDIEMLPLDKATGLGHLRNEKKIEIFLNASYTQKSITYNYLIGKNFDKDNYFLIYQRFTYLWLSLNALASLNCKDESSESLDSSSLRSFCTRREFGKKSFKFCYGEVDRVGKELLTKLSDNSVYTKLEALPKNSSPDDIDDFLLDLIGKEWINESNKKSQEYLKNGTKSKQELTVSLYCLVVLFIGYHLRCSLFHGSRCESIFKKNTGNSNTDTQRKYVRNVTVLIEHFLDQNLTTILKVLENTKKPKTQKKP